MPELPEVEFARRTLVRWFETHRLHRTEAGRRVRTFRGTRIADFERLKGQLLTADRRGKYLLLGFSYGGGIVMHFGMTGKLVRRSESTSVKYSRARFVLDSGEVIHFVDPRLFGRIECVPAEKLYEVRAVVALGLDPLCDGLTPTQLKNAIGRSTQDIKVALMDQARVAGLGNIHTAEALYRAHIHPARKPTTLSTADWRQLAKAILDCIQFALDIEGFGDEIKYVEESGTTNPFLVYGRQATTCRKCKSTITSLRQGGRTTYFCPGCQK